MKLWPLLTSFLIFIWSIHLAAFPLALLPGVLEYVGADNSVGSPLRLVKKPEMILGYDFDDESASHLLAPVREYQNHPWEPEKPNGFPRRLESDDPRFNRRLGPQYGEFLLPAK